MCIIIIAGNVIIYTLVNPIKNILIIHLFFKVFIYGTVFSIILTHVYQFVYLNKNLRHTLLKITYVLDITNNHLSILYLFIAHYCIHRFMFIRCKHGYKISLIYISKLCKTSVNKYELTIHV